MLRILMLLFTISTALAQDAVHNYGAMQIHHNAAVGFHLDLINNGDFNKNKGLVGFYSVSTLSVSGNSNPVFYDAEVAVDNGFFIENTIGIENNLNFISGTISTPREQNATTLSFVSDAFYTGESKEGTFIDGYAAALGKKSFTFPIGNHGNLRPLSFTSMAVNDYAKGGYFNENPNNPSTFSTIFDTKTLENELLVVSEKEFWRLESEHNSEVTLTWDTDSRLADLTDTTSSIRVMGWSMIDKQWENLGSTAVHGDLENGEITSKKFIPDEYSIITLGAIDERSETINTIDLANYYMTPNGDGINDTLVIDGITESPNNTLQIFNRYGVPVYTARNYSNQFDGFSNKKSVFVKNSQLPSGIYFYVVNLSDLNLQHQGYLYLATNEKK